MDEDQIPKVVTVMKELNFCAKWWPSETKGSYHFCAVNKNHEGKCQCACFAVNKETDNAW